MKPTTLYLLALAGCTASLQGAIIVQGNSTASPYAFKTDITATCYDKKAGTFFVGLQSGTDVYTISKAIRPTFTTTPKFSAVLASGSSLESTTIEFLVCAPQPSSRTALVAIPEGSSAQTTNTVTALLNNGAGEITSDALNDASGTAASAGIVQIETNSSSIFAFVKPETGDFGDDDTGIALVGLGATDTAITLDIKDAPTGVDGNKAVELQKASTELKGTSGGEDVIFLGSNAALYWDDVLDRLFIGVPIQTNVNATDIGKSVVNGRLENGALVLQEITPDAAISGGGIDEIIVAEGADTKLTPSHLRVLHASTGPDYLIVDTTTTGTGVHNRIFAFPLVNDIDDPTAATNGTLADKTSALDSNQKFTTAASAPGDLPVNNAITNPEAVVGAGDLPFAVDDAISDIVVFGDGVYVSINKAPDSDNDTGIWSSQAQFDDTGKILRWTPWTKRTTPLNSFPGIALPGGSTHNGAVKFFAIDGVTGNVWIVEGTTDQTVGVTTWSTGTTSTDLITALTASLTAGCYSSLDLDQATRGFLSTTAHRYALFGGGNRVIFTRISEAFDITSLSSPQTVITDFSLSQNFLLTSLPDGAGCCHVLEYSRTSTTADNNVAHTDLGYFFAGTNNGLYVFADSSTGAGFNAINMTTLNIAPFSSGSWHKVTTLSGPIVDIKTSGAGGTLYVIMSDSTATTPLQSTLYSVPFAGTVDAMFAPTNLRTLAQTQVSPFNNAVQFYGIQILATDDPRAANPENKEQLVLATNQGLFRSTASQAGSASVATVTTQAAASWQVVADTNNSTATTAFFGVAGANTPIRHTTWPISIEDENGFKTFDRGSINQFSGNGETGGTAATFNGFFIPEFFNANSSSLQFTTLYPIINFFSDGGRRFFVYNRITDPPDQVKLGTLPFEVSNWNIVQPDIIHHPTLNAVDRIFWVQQIGASGFLMVGTEKGVLGLE